MFLKKSMSKNKKGKVAVGMSGGVDSSVTASLLKKQGYEAVGVFFDFGHDKSINVGREKVCSSKKDQEQAEEVCSFLKIPFYVFDVKEIFRKQVIDYFTAGYKKLLTPNPCVQCNKFIKFSEFWRQASSKLKVDFIATGHYAQIKKGKNGQFKLCHAKDRKKDQTYFLHQLKKTELKHILFPLGKYTKEEVRKMAGDLDLPVAGKKESQEICFVPSKGLASFLRQKIDFKSGPIINIADGKTLGEHQGLFHFTIGQRKGLKLSDGPWFVAGFDKKKNALLVSKKEKDLYKKELTVKNINWLEKPKKFPTRFKCKIRYNARLSVARVYRLSEKKYQVDFTRFQRAPALGQFCVFYKGSQCFGGGEIVKGG
ncbi:MAG TPA: tRNA 2-thiouridine(34) synthase MnmA [Patescibacteria group bacterium]|nr:tRNA 2-thiouridine(34) synthase MnmA [Patescibacteria group bacterium]